MEPEIGFSHLGEGVRLALDLGGHRLFITDLAGTIHSANLDGSNKKTVQVVEGDLTGLACVEFSTANQQAPRNRVRDCDHANIGAAFLKA